MPNHGSRFNTHNWLSLHVSEIDRINISRQSPYSSSGNSALSLTPYAIQKNKTKYTSVKD